MKKWKRKHGRWFCGSGGGDRSGEEWGGSRFCRRSLRRDCDPQSVWTPRGLRVGVETLLDLPRPEDCVSFIWARPSRPLHSPEPAQLNGRGLITGTDHHGPAGVPSDLVVLGTQELYQRLQPTWISQLEMEAKILHIKSTEHKRSCLKKKNLIFWLFERVLIM